ncbi:MAG: glycosyltransferase, partial [Blastocatellia bacterium]|nr:glycosyltransferase [Blastocatellia bacterium]
MNLIQKASKALMLLRNGGVAALRVRLVTLRHKLKLRRQYQKRIATKGAIDRQSIQRQVSAFSRRPTISVVMPVYNVDEKWLRKCIDSVCSQIYENWELCIADDASPGPHIRQVLDEYSAADHRIKVVFRETNGHISAASNSALELATGEFVVLLDHDDELSADALFWVATTIVEEPNITMIYSDEDLIDANGKRSSPAFKPDWSRDLFYSLNLITHLSAYKTDVLRSIGGFRVGMEGSQDYDLALRVIETIDETQIKHIPRILYHWRAIPGSVALSGDEKPYAHERARVAIREHFERTGKAASVEATELNLHRVRYTRTDKFGKVLVAIIGSRDAVYDRLVDDSYDCEVVWFENDSKLEEELDRAIKSSESDVVCFMNSEIRSLPLGWLNDLVSFLEVPEIGAVGGKLVDTANRIVDGPLYLSNISGVHVANEGLENTYNGNMLRNKVVGNYSAVSLSLMAIRRSDLLDTGVIGNESIDVSLLDGEICLRLSEIGKRIVSVPFVVGTV